MNINSIKEKIVNIHLKLNQKETKYTKIAGGYKISEPLNETQRMAYRTKLSELTLELEKLNSISLKS
jgi:hypothetical protein